MRSGYSRGVTLAFGLACASAFALSGTSASRADGFSHTIPSLVPAVDVNTGGPYYAPPVPYGHYAGKNLGGHAKKLGGLLHGGLLHHGKGGCGLCGGAGCDACGGGGGGKGGLFHHGGGGGGGACGHGGACGNGGPCAMGGGGLGHGHGQGHGGLFHKCGSGCGGHASTVVVASGQGVPAPQMAPVVMPTAQCADPGCSLLGSHRHRGCGLCGGKGCGGCATAGPCNSCGGKGCGLCGSGGACNACGGRGCGFCGKLGKGCGLCGGKGCAACAKLKGLVGHMLGHDKIKWFVGAGGPVPLTPGYTPYVVTTRSPRDFLAFPPFAP